MKRAALVAVLAIATAFTAGAQLSIPVYSAVSRKPIRGALAWWIASDAGTPIVASSELSSDEKGVLHLPLIPGRRLRVWAAGHEVVELEPREAASLRELALWPAAGVKLHLGAHSEAVQLRYFIGERDPRRELAAATDAAGDIAWPGTPRAGIRVEVVDPRFTLAALTLHAGEKRDLTLQAARPIAARVVDANGHPVAKAAARAFVPLGPGPLDVRRVSWTASADGLVTLSSLPSGEHIVEFAAPGFVTRSMRLSADSAAAREVRLERGGALMLVVRGEDGPIDGACVALENGEQLRSDRSGRVVIPGLDLRQQPRLAIAAENYLGASVDVRRDMKSPYEVRLRRGSGFRFRLLDASTGEPIEQTRVRVRTGGRWGDRQLTGTRGEYFAAGFEGGPMQLEIATPDYLPTKLSADPSGGTADLGVVFLGRGAEVTGVLTDVRTGQPLAGARVETIRRGEMGTMAARLFGDAAVSTTTADGRFRLSGLEPGMLCATVSHPALGQSPLLLGQIEEAAPRDAGVLSIGETSSLEGTLHDSDGAPIRDASVDLRFGPVYTPCMSMTATLDEQGRYRFDRVTPGPYQLVAVRNHEVLGTRPVTVRGGADNREDLEIHTVNVRGSVVVDGLPGGGGSVMLKREGSTDFNPPTIFFTYAGAGIDPRQRPATDIVGKASFTVAPDGTFAGRTRLDEGDYDVVWTPPDNSAWYHMTVSLRADAPTLDVRLECSGVAMPGRATSPDGSPVANAVVRLIDGTGRIHRTVFTGADGAFSVPHVTPGRWTVEGASRGLSGRQSIDVEAQDADALQLVLQPKPSSQLVVQIAADDDAAPIDSVMVTNAAGVVRMSRADGASATFSDLPPATYKVFALDRRGGIIDGSVVSAGAGRTVTTLSARPTRTVRIRCRNAEPGARAALLRDRYSLAPVLASEGLVPSVLDDGTVALPPLSDGRWTIRIAGRTHDIDVSRDETIDLDD